MRSYIARQSCALSLQSILRISPMKWLILACMPIFLIFFDSGAVYSAPTYVPVQSNTGETPFDYTSSRLVGAMRGGRGSVVVFENAKGEQTFYRMGETLPDGSKITAVNTNSIIVKRSDGSKVEYFVAPGAAGKPATASAGRPVIDSSATYMPPVASNPDGVRLPRHKRYTTTKSENEE